MPDFLCISEMHFFAPLLKGLYCRNDLLESLKLHLCVWINPVFIFVLVCLSVFGGSLGFYSNFYLPVNEKNANQGTSYNHALIVHKNLFICRTWQLGFSISLGIYLFYKEMWQLTLRNVFNGKFGVWNLYQNECKLNNVPDLHHKTSTTYSLEKLGCFFNVKSLKVITYTSRISTILTRLNYHI